jgi:hypothetical protein
VHIRKNKGVAPNGAVFFQKRRDCIRIVFRTLTNEGGAFS